VVALSLGLASVVKHHNFQLCEMPFFFDRRRWKAGQLGGSLQHVSTGEGFFSFCR